MTPLVLNFASVGADDLPSVGGKGANLGVLAAAGLPVPGGFCVTTEAFRLFTDDPALEPLFDALDAVEPEDLDAARAAGAALRAALEARPVPPPVADALLAAWRAAGPEHAYAVRSSATAEDLPEASFAGQQDTYLQVIGEQALLDRTRACWASLYTDRAILYRLQNGIVHREVALAVVIQRMIASARSGILFTADPLTGHRGIASIDAGFGLGEALVSGRVSADLYRVQKSDGAVIEARPGDKALAIVPVEGGGTRDEALTGDRRSARALTDEEAGALTALGTRIEALQGFPQDIEWCIDAEGVVWIVQSRPITSLYPNPGALDEGAMGVWFCFNHFQVMTDAMPPMTCSVWLLMMPFGRDTAMKEAIPAPWGREVGGRLYIDLSRFLRLPPARRIASAALQKVDELIAAAVDDVASRPGFHEGPRVSLLSLLRFMLPKAAAAQRVLWFSDGPALAAKTTATLEQWVEDQRARIEGAGDLGARLRESRAALAGLMPVLFRIPPKIFGGFAAGILLRRLGRATPEEKAALSRGLAGNVTTDMDLAVGDVADEARGHDALTAALRAGENDLAVLAALPGGAGFAAALDAFLLRYGMRAPGEIDLTRDRWRDDPSSILRVIAGALAQSEKGAHRAHHRALAEQAERAGAALVERAGRGPLGFLKGRLARRFLARFRALAGLREHPKFAIIRVLDVVRAQLLLAGARLVEAGRADRAEDVWFFDIDELIARLDGADDLRPEIARRRARHVRNAALYPPRVLTSEGESPMVRHDADVPAGALAGSAASAGVVEGIVRVITDPAGQTLEKGEILVAPFTDPGWTPLFLNAAGLVMEVGGLMTHGSVVAREYGIPAVVCVPGCTTTLRTGQRVRVNGDEGWVQVLEESEQLEQPVQPLEADASA